MTKIKICGIRRLEDVLYVNEFLPDFIGFIFVEGRSRYITLAKAIELKNQLDKRIKTVGVFLNADINYVIDICKSNCIDYIQLHGSESSEYIKELRDITKKPIIKAYSNFEYADYILLDNINPGSGNEWNYTIDNSKPCFIAGGLNVNNIKNALKLNPYAVDISSGVETNGYKDKEKIREIVRLVREYEG